jgi:hypothetical protein
MMFNRSILIPIIFAGATMATTAAGAQNALTGADGAFNKAVAAHDQAALGKLLDADFTWTTAEGKILTRFQAIESIPKPVAPGAPGPNAESHQYVYGGLADVQINQGRAHALHVWVKRPEGWKVIVYQEVMSLEAPPTVTPGAGKECENPCQSIPFTPANETERQVAQAYSKLETAAHAHNSANFAPMVAEEFVALSSNSNKLQTKRGRIEEFNHAKDAGVAPTPLLTARMYAFGDAVLMLSEHKPDRGKPLHVTRIWIKRGGSWQETLSYQTSLNPVPTP